MMNFSDLQIVAQVEESDNHLYHNKRYIIGADPFLQRGVLSGVNVFSIYDKYVMRHISITVTTRTFDQWLVWIMKKPRHSELGFSQREYITSRKFINKNGTATNPSQIRRDN